MVMQEDSQVAGKQQVRKGGCPLVGTSFRITGLHPVREVVHGRWHVVASAAAWARRKCLHKKPGGMLLQLPPELVQQHVWPHLGPQARSALQATCRPLRAQGQALYGPCLRLMLTAADLFAAEAVARAWQEAGSLQQCAPLLHPPSLHAEAAVHNAAAAAPYPPWATRAFPWLNIVRHCAGIVAVELVLVPPRDQLEGRSGRPWAGSAISSSSLSGALYTLGKAARGRLTQLRLVVAPCQELEWAPCALAAMAQAWPLLNSIELVTGSWAELAASGHPSESAWSEAEAEAQAHAEAEAQARAAAVAAAAAGRGAGAAGKVEAFPVTVVLKLEARLIIKGTSSEWAQAYKRLAASLTRLRVQGNAWLAGKHMGAMAQLQGLTSLTIRSPAWEGYRTSIFRMLGSLLGVGAGSGAEGGRCAGNSTGSSISSRAYGAAGSSTGSGASASARVTIGSSTNTSHSSSSRASGQAWAQLHELDIGPDCLPADALVCLLSAPGLAGVQALRFACPQDKHGPRHGLFLPCLSHLTALRSLSLHGEGLLSRPQLASLPTGLIELGIHAAPRETSGVQVRAPTTQGLSLTGVRELSIGGPPGYAYKAAVLPVSELAVLVSSGQLHPQCRLVLASPLQLSAEGSKLPSDEARGDAVGAGGGAAGAGSGAQEADLQKSLRLLKAHPGGCVYRRGQVLGPLRQGAALGPFAGAGAAAAAGGVVDSAGAAAAVAAAAAGAGTVQSSCPASIAGSGLWAEYPGVVGVYAERVPASLDQEARAEEGAYLAQQLRTTLAILQPRCLRVCPLGLQRMLSGQQRLSGAQPVRVLVVEACSGEDSERLLHNLQGLGSARCGSKRSSGLFMGLQELHLQGFDGTCLVDDKGLLVSKALAGLVKGHLTAAGRAVPGLQEIKVQPLSAASTLAWRAVLAACRRTCFADGADPDAVQLIECWA